MEQLELQQSPATEGNVVKRYFRTMPLLFPLVGLFLAAMAAIEFGSYISDHGFAPVYWSRPILYGLYFFFWLFVCFARKWAALGFLLLTIAGMAWFLFGPDMQFKHATGDVLIMPIPVNVLFSFLLLFYYRRMR